MEEKKIDLTEEVAEKLSAAADKLDQDTTQNTPKKAFLVVVHDDGFTTLHDAKDLANAKEAMLPTEFETYIMKAEKDLEYQKLIGTFENFKNSLDAPVYQGIVKFFAQMQKAKSEEEPVVEK